MTQIQFHDAPIDRMTLTSTILGGRETVTVTAEMEDLSSVIETLERFLKASGYEIDGTLTIVRDHYQIETRKTHTGEVQ